jgi:hypothetical protein
VTHVHVHAAQRVRSGVEHVPLHGQRAVTEGRARELDEEAAFVVVLWEIAHAHAGW